MSAAAARNAASTITKRDFAIRFGISENQLERLFQQGMPHEKHSRRVLVPMPAGRVWYHEYLVEKGRRQSAPKSSDDARRRRAAAEAELAELDLAQRRKETVLLVEAERWVADAFGRVRAKLQNLTPRLAGVVVGLTSVQQAQSRIEPVVMEAMEELRVASDVPTPADLDDDGTDSDEKR